MYRYLNKNITNYICVFPSLISEYKECGFDQLSFLHAPFYLVQVRENIIRITETYAFKMTMTFNSNCRLSVFIPVAILLSDVRGRHTDDIKYTVVSMWHIVVSYLVL